MITVLVILIKSKRPLTLTEFNTMLALKQTDRIKENFQPRLQFNISRRLKRICGPIMRIFNGRVYLIHQTAKEFLVKPAEIERITLQTWKHNLDPA